MTPDPAQPPPKPASKRVSSQHTLERVRNNQRRHRARRREHIASLEAKVAEMVETIATLRSQVDSLQQELAWHRNRVSPPTSSSDAGTSSPGNENGPEGPEVCLGSPVLEPPTPTIRDISQEPFEPPQGFDVDLVDEAMSSFSPLPTASTSVDVVPATRLLSAISSQTSTIEDIPSPEHPCNTCCIKDESTLYLDPALALAPPTPNLLPQPTPPTQHREEPPSIPCNIVQNLLPEYVLHPSMSHLYKDTADEESTTLCSEAYVLISQQNVKGLGQDELAGWLWSGFRRALRPGEGCRVTTNALFGLLAYISDP